MASTRCFLVDSEGVLLSVEEQYEKVQSLLDDAQFGLRSNQIEEFKKEIVDDLKKFTSVQ